MADTSDVRKQIEHFIERAEDEISHAGHQLTKGINRRTGRRVAPASEDIDQALHEVFDFAERVLRSQRRMVRDAVKAINEQTDEAAQKGRTATRRITKRATARRKAVAKRVAAVRKASAKRSPAKKSPPKKAVAKRTPAKKAPPKKAVAKRAPAKKVPAKPAPAKKAAPKTAAAKKTTVKKAAPGS